MPTRINLRGGVFAAIFAAISAATKPHIVGTEMSTPLIAVESL